MHACSVAYADSVLTWTSIEASAPLVLLITCEVLKLYQVYVIVRSHLWGITWFNAQGLGQFGSCIITQSLPLLALSECIKNRVIPSNVWPLNVLVLSAWPSCSCARLSLLCCALRNLTHGKVCFTRFNAPSGDTFRAIWLAGGHVICTNIGYQLILNLCTAELNTVCVYIHIGL